MPANSNARAGAAFILHRVAFGGRSLDDALGVERTPDRNRPLIQELAIGSVRHFFSLSNEIASQLIAPLKPRDSIVHCLLLIGAYQLRHTRVPAYAAVSETVRATRDIGRPWARGLVNHVLRKLTATEPPVSANEEVRWDHPIWLIDRIREDYPEHWGAILTASLSRAPLSLRVNLMRTTRGKYLDLLAGAGVSAHIGLPEETLVLDTPVPAASLPGFTDGTVSVQDEGAQHAAALLAPNNGDRILDACAAPGGKAMHLLERAPDSQLMALDLDIARCELIRNECRRHGYDPGLVIQGDATHLDWWDGGHFQRILVDAPCSGTGTMRRHPDIKLLKRATDVPEYQDLQRRLLMNLWRALAPDGRMLYCTCSVLSAENDCVVDEFLAKTRDATLEPIEGDWGIPTRNGRQLLPSIGGPDGFYYAAFRKQ